MIPIEQIRNNIEYVKKQLALKGDPKSVDTIFSLDKSYRSYISKSNELRAKRNQVSDKISVAKKSGDTADKEIKDMRIVGEEIKSIEEKANEIKSQLDELLLRLPNLPHESTPEGKDETENKLIREWGEETKTEHELKTHLDLGDDLDLFDFEAAAKISGSGFPLYKGKGAKLERALINYMLDFQTKNHGYMEIFPPFMVRDSSPLTTGNLPKFSDDMYYIQSDELWMIPTAEVPITNLHQNEILSEDQLPLKYAAYSACFRREAGSHGKDTKGLLRLHQFNKVELVQFVKPENSYEVLEDLTANAEAILQSLGLKYRVIELCSGDLSFAAAKCYDLELWAPAEEKWLEVSSCSNFESFQARRGNIRYRNSKDNNIEFVHTLNGSGVATPRLLVSLLETYQNSDGSISIPKPLQPYIGLEVID
ncbi:MAG: serine--tRNA ligase [Candidatus Marinimicrobia bacterium]|nr:serine--tRNA ligase [Candidatus Neomarinimicrobiota bacterium]